MSLFTVVFVLASLSLGNCTLHITAMVTVPFGGAGGGVTTTKRATFECSVSGYRIAVINDSIVIGPISFTGQCYVVSRKEFAKKLGITLPFPDGLKVAVTEARQADTNENNGAVQPTVAGSTVHGSVLLDAFSVPEVGLTSKVNSNVDLVATGTSSSSYPAFTVVQAKAGVKRETLKGLKSCVLLALTPVPVQQPIK